MNQPICVEEGIPEILRIGDDLARRRKKEEEQQREQEQRRLKKLKEEEKSMKRIVITEPLHVEHKLHVDENLNWTDANSLQLLNKLGEGAYGIVYRALHVPTNTELAIKTVPISEDSEESTDILKEIDILKQCRHDNVVSLYGCVFSENSLWIIMDYCSVGSVKDFMKHSPRSFTEKEISAVIYYVLRGLSYLHSISIIHRDLKSANILLTDSGEAKIADFGVSYQVSNTLAKKTTVVGTPLFMAPESLDGGDYSEKADIWSLAITAIEMHDGQPPHNDEHIMRAMLLITQNDPPTLSDPSSVSPEFNHFLERCLKKESKERATAEELMKDPFIANGDHQITLMEMIREFKEIKQKKELEKLEQERIAEEKRKAEERKEEQRKEEERLAEAKRKLELFEKMTEKSNQASSQLKHLDLLGPGVMDGGPSEVERNVIELQEMEQSLAR